MFWSAWKFFVMFSATRNIESCDNRGGETKILKKLVTMSGEHDKVKKEPKRITGFVLKYKNIIRA